MKKKLLTLLQGIVTLGILAWVFHDPGRRAEMWAALRSAKVPWLLAGFACYGVVEVLAAFRWHLLLRVQDIHLPRWRIGALFMMGIFFNTFMPGGTGGDVLKIYYLLKEVPTRKEGGLLSVLMDRIIGLLGLIVVSSVIIALQYRWLATTPVTRHLTWVLLLILAGSIGAIAFSFLVSGFRLAHRLPDRMPLRDKLIDASAAYHAYAHRWRSSLAALCTSFALHLASFSVSICVAHALAMNLSAGAILTVMPIILTISALPISVGGTGVREGWSRPCWCPCAGCRRPWP